jgi:F0F1-type ATP synthase delta subunit
MAHFNSLFSVNEMTKAELLKILIDASQLDGETRGKHLQEIIDRLENKAVIQYLLPLLQQLIREQSIEVPKNLNVCWDGNVGTVKELTRNILGRVGTNFS